MSTRSEPSPVSAGSDSVLRELTLLRQGDGLSMRKIREHCPELQGLPVVRDELARRSLAASDLHVAAYEAIHCAVSVLVPRTDHQRVLASTMNMGGRGLAALEARRGKLRAELYLTVKAYTRLEADAYVHLAGALVAARRSPCNEAVAVEQAEELSLNVTITLSPDQVSYLLNLVTYESRPALRSLLALRLLAVLPNALEALTESYGLAAAESGEPMLALFEGLLRTAWPPTFNGVGPHVFRAESMSQLLRFTGSPLLDNHKDVAAAEQSTFSPATFVLGEALLDEFFATKEVSLLTLALLVQDVEERDAWREYLPPSQLRLEPVPIA